MRQKLLRHRRGRRSKEAPKAKLKKMSLGVSKSGQKNDAGKERLMTKRIMTDLTEQYCKELPTFTRDGRYGLE